MNAKLIRVERLLEALRDERSPVELDVAALELASIEFPGLDIEGSLFRLDHLAEQLQSKLTSNAPPLEFIETANELLFKTLQFRGNEEQYYDPRNSCLNSVLIRRLGIPISLSVLYVEIARRLRRPVYGVGLPGHSLWRTRTRTCAIGSIRFTGVEFYHLPIAVLSLSRPRIWICARIRRCSRRSINARFSCAC